MENKRRPRRINEILRDVYAKQLDGELKKDDFMDEEELPKHDMNYLMNASYDSLTRNEERTVDIFIIFEDGDTVIEVPKGKGHRSMAIDRIMNYFIEVEDYEKCAVLRDLKTKIIEFGD